MLLRSSPLHVAAGTLALNSICIDNNEEKAQLGRNP